jgi:hypothetical protein
VDDLRDIEGQDVEQRVGPEVLGGRQQTEHQLQPNSTIATAKYQ